MREGTLETIFGTDEPFQVNAFLTQCFATLTNFEAGGAGDHNDMRSFVVSIVKDIGARDAVERMLALQMAVTRLALIRAGRGMVLGSMLPQVEAYSTAYNKLARTYAVQMEALRKHRNGGQKKARVEHVHVNPGGEAIVGEVHHGGRGLRMKDDVNSMAQAHAAPRCRAHSKRTGQFCQAPAVAGWPVCHAHSAGGGKAGPTHLAWKHGMRSQAAVEMRWLANELAREAREVDLLTETGRSDQWWPSEGLRIQATE